MLTWYFSLIGHFWWIFVTTIHVKFKYCPFFAYNNNGHGVVPGFDLDGPIIVFQVFC